jgi:Tat protein translocase TatB subunit
MFGSIGITELIVIAGIALIVLGPDKFPEFAKLAIRSMRDIRKYVADAQQEIAKELDPMKKKLDEASKIDPEAYLENLVGDSNDDEDDDSINPEPEFSDEELQAATDNLTEDWDGGVDMSDSRQEHEGGGSVDEEDTTSLSQEELVEYDPYAGESESADPYGVRSGSASDQESSEDIEAEAGDDPVELEETERLDG